MMASAAPSVRGLPRASLCHCLVDVVGFQTIARACLFAVRFEVRPILKARNTVMADPTHWYMIEIVVSGVQSGDRLDSW